jgi:acetate kinase
MSDALLVLNAGSSSLKFSVFLNDGENAAPIRARVCRGANWLGLDLDEVANTNGGPCISREGSRVSAWVIPTNEESMIARHTRRLVSRGG